MRAAARNLLRAPGFTLAAVAAIALGVGASTAVFSFTDRILFRPLPYPAEEQLVWLGMTAPIADSEFLLSYDFVAWSKAQTAFTAMASTTGASDCELTDNDPARLRCVSIDAALLPLLGLHPQLGRHLTADDDQPGAPPTALLSAALWRARFAANPATVGQTIDLDGRAVHVIGILPDHFELPNLAHADILRPHQRDPMARANPFLFAYARLKPGLSIQEAAARLLPLYNESLKSIPPAFVKDIRFAIHPLRDRQVRDSRRAAQLLLAAVALVLLISMANVANLLLARASGRRREMAIRAALGASRVRLLTATLAESLLLAALGGLAGVTLAAGLLKLFATTAPAGIARLDQATLDARILGATFAVTLLSGLAFAFVPVFRPVSLESLTGGRIAGYRRQWLRPALVVSQIALSLVLLCGAGLLLQSLWNLTNVPLGMRSEDLITVQAQLPRQRYPERAQQLAFWEAAEERLARLPGVTRFAVSNSVPPAGQAMTTIYAMMEIEGRGRAAADGVGGMVVIRQVTPGYHATLQIPIQRGRAFTEDDRRRPDPVTILDETLAARLFPNEDALGKRIKSGTTGWMEVIGIAANVRNAGLRQTSDPEFYMVKRHHADDGRASNTAILLAPLSLAPAIREEFRQLDPRLTLQIDTIDQRIAKLQATPRFQTLLLGGFALTGLLLSALGLYGVIALFVSQRTSEIGVRMALGATPSRILRMVLSQAGAWLAAGLALGLLGVAASARAIESLLFGATPHSPLPLAAAILTLTLAAGFAAWLPARRAARVAPVQALRYE